MESEFTLDMSDLVLEWVWQWPQRKLQVPQSKWAPADHVQLSMCRSAILQLVQSLDEYIPDPVRDLDKPFTLPVEDVFSIQGRGTVVTGRIETGIVKVGDEVEIVGIQAPQKTTVTGGH